MQEEKMELSKKEGTASGPKKEWPVVKKVELPMKEVLFEDECRKMANTIADTAETGKESEKVAYEALANIKLDHTETGFCLFCACSNCLDYREVILQLMNDHLKSRSMWKILQRTIKNFFRPIIENAPPKVHDIYDTLVEDDKFSWLENGVLNKSKHELIDFIWDLSLTENLIFVLFSTLLIVDDAHQFFELISYQVECFAKAYAEGLTEKLRSSEDKCTSVDLITYVLNGYEEFLKVALRMSTYLFTFERIHLEQFSLSWILLSKRMYQKWVYSKFSKIMPDCVIKLKDEVSADEYTTLVRKYIKFDDDMVLVNKKWRDVWILLNKYHSSEKDIQRRKRIKSIIKIFDAIKTDQLVPTAQFIDIPEWETHSDRQLVWQNMVAYIKQRWPVIDEIRLNATVCTDQCKKCQSCLEFHIFNCQCVTCLIAGGSSTPKTTMESEKHSLCSKCILDDKGGKKDNCSYVSKIISQCTNKPATDSNHVKLDEDDINEMTFDDFTSMFGIGNNAVAKKGLYHLSWAVFKHLKDRRPYPYKTIEKKYFCSNCPIKSCILAKQIINNEVAFGWTRHLVKNYQPIWINDDEVLEMMTSFLLYNRKVISMNLVVYDPPNEDVVVKTFWTFLISAVAHFIDIDDFEVKNEPELEHLKMNNNDIELPIEFLETHQKPNVFLDNIDKVKGLFLREPKSVISLETIAKMLCTKEKEKEVEKKEESPRKISPEKPKKEERIAPIMKAEAPSTKPPPQPQPQPDSSISRMPDPPKPSNRHGFQCCSDHSDALEICKENHFNKMCFHEKECSHVRMNETRDRLRKKLSQLSNAKKNSKAINKNMTKNPLELLKSLNKNPPSLSSLSKEMAKIQNKANISKEVLNKSSPVKIFPPDKEIIENIKLSDTKEAATVKTKPEEEVVQNKNLDAWVKDALSFIEGCDEPKKFKNTTNNKKAAKKAKQKQKKEEQKRIEELQDLRSQFHDLYCKEYVSKNDLKTQKASKKRDKKRIGDLESNIKKLSRAKSKIEASILDLISIVKSSNKEFKFAYLPTKEQQQVIIQKAPQADNSSTTQYKSENINSISPLGSQFGENQLFVQNMPLLQAHGAQIAYVRQPVNTADNTKSDPSKRMVTIKRVNLPHVSEPQVTVTAKGPSPDKDKLLYTFINGQLVPANSLDPRSVNVLPSNMFSPQLSQMQLAYKHEHMRMQAEAAAAAAAAAAATSTAPASQKSDVIVEKTKTQLKKERKRTKKLALEQKEQEELMKAESLKPVVKEKANNTKLKQKNAKQDITEDILKLDKEKVKSQIKEKKIVRENNIKDNTIQQNVNLKTVELNKTKNNSISKNIALNKNVTTPVINNIEKPLEKSSEISKTKKSAKKKAKVVDNGQFDNNQFKMLHLDELSSESDESERDLLLNQNKVLISNQKVTSKSTASTTKPDTSKKLSKDIDLINNMQLKNDSSLKSVVNTTSVLPSCKPSISEKTTLSKKQKKLVKKQNAKLLKNTESKLIEKAVLNAENMAKSLHHSMQRLHLNADTTIELAKDTLDEPLLSAMSNVSIMDQLNQGVNVEDLTLPPGITLTKVDPVRAEALNAKRESIGKLSQPLQSQSQPIISNPSSLISPAVLATHYGRYADDQSGVIMVDAMGLKSCAEQPNSGIDSKKSKKNKRKNKKKKTEGNTNELIRNPNQQGKEPKMVTLRNPMFHGSAVQNLQLPMTNRTPIAPLPMDQPAAIIKNDNGMFTIRNPAVHPAYANGIQNSYHQPNIGTARQAGKKNISAIGSEVKENKKKITDQQQWQQIMSGQASPQPHHNTCRYLSGINCTPMQQKYQESNYYNGGTSAGYDVFNQNSSDCRNLFEVNPPHNCDDSPPPSVTGFNHYLNGTHPGDKKYDDMSFLRNLIPGQRLNSEVTIHNINESKFSRQKNSTISHGVEITPIACSSNSMRSNDLVSSSNQNHVYGMPNKNYPEVLDNPFAPNQTLNLNELESDERDIECFKRFSYAFEPPKNKPKVNINVNDLMVNSRNSRTSQNSRTSPFFDESLENFVRNMNSLKLASETNSVNVCTNQAGVGNNWRW